MWSTESLTDATALLLNITSTDFISALVITNHILGYTKAITTSLQAEAIDVVAAARQINTVTTTLQQVRDNIDRHHAEWYQEVEAICLSEGLQVSLPRRCARQQHRSNMPADTPEVYYRRTITIPVLDHMISEFQTRFTSLQQQALQGLVLVPSALVVHDAGQAKVKFQQLAHTYKDDLPSPMSASAEFQTWATDWTQQHDQLGPKKMPTTPADTLQLVKKTGHQALYPNIVALLTLLCVLPLTSCESERPHSGHKRIKTPMWSRMVNERLSSLALLNLHRNIPIDIPAIVDEFAHRHPCRMQLNNIIAD